MPRICILVFCGLPGSGKSQLAERLLRSELVAHGRYPPLRGRGPLFLHVNYDKIMPDKVERQLLSHISDVDTIHGHATSDKTLSRWNQYRKEIVRCVKRHIHECLPGVENTSKGPTGCDLQQLPDLQDDTDKSFPARASSHEEKSSSQGDGQCQHDMNSLLQDEKTSSCHQEDTVWELFRMSVTPPGDRLLEEFTDFVYVIDDNMYYRGMRHEYYRMARRCHAGFAQVFLNTPIQVCHERNARRPHPVSSEVIDSMASRIEPPGGSDIGESHVLVLDGEHEHSNILEVLELVEEALGDPVQPLLEVDEAAKAEARVICSTSFIHQSDRVLRTLVAKTMAQVKGSGVTKLQLRQMAEALNAKRSKILEEMRLGHVRVQRSLNLEADVGSQPNSPLYQFIEELFFNESECEGDHDANMLTSMTFNEAISACDKVSLGSSFSVPSPA